MRYGSAILLGLCLGCGGATANRDLVEVELGAAPSGVARVCVLRPERSSPDVTMRVEDNGRLVGATRGGSYFCYLAAPGPHQITSVDDDTGPTLLTARAGGRYFLHQEVAMLEEDLHAHLTFVDDLVARELLEACEVRVHVSVPGHDDNPRAQPIAPARRSPARTPEKRDGATRRDESVTRGAARGAARVW